MVRRNGHRPAASSSAAPDSAGTRSNGARKSCELRTTLYRLRCFQVIVEEGSLKRATERLHTTQPALSYQVKQLEEEMGAQLFHRRPGGMFPTEAGQLLFQHAQQVSGAVSQAERAIKALSQDAVGEIRAGTINSVGLYFLPGLLAGLRSLYPEARPTVLFRGADDLVAALLADQVDLAILADPRIDRRLHYETLCTESVSLISGPSHPFFGCAVVEPAQLRETPFIALSPETPTGALIAGYMDRLGVAAQPVVTCENVETVKRLVAIGMGVAFLPDMVTEREVARGERSPCRIFRSEVSPPLTRQIMLVTWNEPHSSRAIGAFIKEVRRYAARWPSSEHSPERRQREGPATRRSRAG